MPSYDVVLVSDFRFPGGTSSAIAHEIRALSAAGLRIGLVACTSTLLRNRRLVNPQIRQCIDSGMASLVSPEEHKVEAGLGVFHNPLVFEHLSQRLPDMKLGETILVAHQGPIDRSGIPYYDIGKVNEICAEIGGGRMAWGPISPIVRSQLAAAAPALALAEDDWRNVIFMEDWAVPRPKVRHEVPVVGRHSRPDREKWPATRQDVLEVYPDDPTVDVRLLGVGAPLARIMGEMPERWTTYKFNQIPAAEFLSGIDFFVYYHHPHWVEAFGRTVAEAIAGGCVPILPPYFEATFGEAAFYAPPEDSIALVRELHGDRRRCRSAVSRGRHIISERHGPDQHVQRVLSILGRRRPAANGAAARHGRAANGTRPPIAVTLGKQSGSSHDDATRTLDIVVAADMATARDCGLRIAHEIRIQADLGYRTGLLHVPAGRASDKAVRPEIDFAVRTGAAEVVLPDDLVRCRAVIVHSPERLFDHMPERLARIETEQLIVVADRPAAKLYDVVEKHRLLSALFRAQPSWHPTNPDVRRSLVELWPEMPIAEDDWTPVVSEIPWRERHFRYDRPVVGAVRNGSQAATAAEPPGDCLLRVLHQAAPKEEDLPGCVEHLQLGEIAAGKLLDGIDFLLLDDSDIASLPETLVAEAMVRGVVPLAGPRTAARLGSQSTPCPPGEAGGRIGAFFDAPEEYAAAARRTARLGRDAFAPAHHGHRLARAIGRRPARAAASRPEKRRIAFVSSNGVGLGHLTRLLAIARRMPAEIQPVFVTMSQAFGIVQKFGYPTEYIPFHGYGEMAHVDDWNEWFKLHLERILDAYGISGLVFDGGAPYGGLVRAIAPRPDLRTVWVRRGMWRAGQFNEPLLRRQKYFDIHSPSGMPSDVSFA